MKTAAILITIMSVLAVAGAVFLRSRKSHEEHIIPEVEAAGLTYVFFRIPRFWEFGTFPIFRSRSGFIETKVGPLDGEYDAIRIVHVRDRRGREHEVWMRLTFIAFILTKIASKPDLLSLNKA